MKQLKRLLLLVLGTVLLTAAMPVAAFADTGDELTVYDVDEAVYSYYDGYDGTLIGASVGEVIYPSFPYRENITYQSWQKDGDNYYATYTGTQYVINGVAQSQAPQITDGNILVNGTWMRIAGTSTGSDGNAYGTITVYYYTAEPIPVTTYTVTFTDGNGHILSRQTVEEGTAAAAPSAPAMAGHNFDGWDANFSNVHSDITVNARWKKNAYSVLFLNEDGSVYASQKVLYGNSATLPARPIKAGYTFLGWSGNYTNIQEDTILSPQWEKKAAPSPGSGSAGSTPKEDKTYTVTFTDGLGKTLKIQSGVKAGARAVAPSIPSRTGYVFAGWSRSYANVNSDMTVNALWQSNTAGMINNTANKPAALRAVTVGGNEQQIAPGQTGLTTKSNTSKTEKKEETKSEEEKAKEDEAKKEEVDENKDKAEPAQTGDTNTWMTYASVLMLLAFASLLILVRKQTVKK